MLIDVAARYAVNVSFSMSNCTLNSNTGACVAAFRLPVGDTDACFCPFAGGISIKHSGTEFASTNFSITSTIFLNMNGTWFMFKLKDVIA